MHLRVAALDGKSGVVDWEAEVEEAAVGDGDEGALLAADQRVVVVVFSLNGNLRKHAVPAWLVACLVWRHTSRPPFERASIIRPGKLPTKSPLTLAHTHTHTVQYHLYAP